MAARSEQADRQARASVQHATHATGSGTHQAASELSQPSTQDVQAAVLSPQQASPAQLQEIQRLYGNRAVQRLLSTGAPAVPPPPNETNPRPTVSRASLAGSLQGGALDSGTQSQI